MHSAMPTARQDHAVQVTLETEHPDTIETRLWLEEHEWLYTLLRSDANVSPTFRFPDLISACVSLVFLHDGAATRTFGFLGTQLVLRPPLTPRRRESMWRQQYELLLAVQRSPANQHPNSRFQPDPGRLAGPDLVARLTSAPFHQKHYEMKSMDFFIRLGTDPQSHCQCGKGLQRVMAKKGAIS